MVAYTKNAIDVFNPEDSNGDARPVDNGEVQTWGEEVQQDIAEARALAAAGARWVDPVRVATTANVSLSSGLENGDVLVGITLATGDRVALLGQTDAAKGGIYVVQASGAAVRSSDANSASEMVGLAFFVKEGSTNGGKQFVQTTPAPITLGTTPLAFREISDQTALNANFATKADKATALGGTGLAVATGNLGASPSIAVAKASGAEVITGTEDAKAVTPAGNKAALDAAVANANLLFDPYNEIATDDPYAGAYGHWSGGQGGGTSYQVAAPAFTTASSNIRFKTPVLQKTNGDIDRYWPVKECGIRPGDVINVAVLAWFSVNGGTLGVFARSSDNTVLGSVSVTGLASGADVRNAQITIPANTEHLLIRCGHASGDTEIGAYAATRGTQKPAFNGNSGPKAYRLAALPEVPNIMFDPFGDLIAATHGGGSLLDNDVFTGDGPIVTPVGWGTPRAVSPDSPWGKAGLQSVYYTVSTRNQVRRIVKIAKGLAGLSNGDKARIRVKANFASSGGAINIYFRDAANATISGANQLFAGQAAGLVEVTTRTIVVPSNADHLLVEVIHTTGLCELLGVAVGLGGRPSWQGAPTPAAHLGRTRRQRNAAPDAFFRLHAAGITTVDGYPVMQDVTPNVVTVSASPYKPKLGNLISVSTAANRRIAAKRLGMQLGQKLTFVQAFLFANDSPSFGLGFNFRRTDTTVVSTQTKTFATGYFKAGVVTYAVFTVNVTQAMLDETEYVELRYNVAGTAITGGYHILGLGIYVGEEYPLLDDSSAADDMGAIERKAIADTIAAMGSVPNHYKGKALRETRMRLMQRAFDEAARIVHLAIGDSHTHNRARYCDPFLQRMQNRKNDAGNAVGDGGGGWVGFGSLSGTNDNGNARSTYGYTRTGSGWDVSAYYTGGGPDLGAITSSTPGDRVTLTKPASPTHTDAKLFWKGTADGVVRYSWDNGSNWTTRNVQGTVGNLGTASLNTGMPAGAGTLIIEVVSGSCTLHGLDWVSAASGYVLHKCGATGSAASSWIGVNAAQQQASWTALAPTIVSILLGVNDNNTPVTKAVYKANVEAIILRVRAAVPTADIWLIAPAQTPRIKSVLLAEYAAALYELAVQYGCCFTSLQDVFGDASNPSQYSSQGARPWFQDDGSDGDGTNDIHPNTTTGSRSMVADMVRTVYEYP